MNFNLKINMENDALWNEVDGYNAQELTLVIREVANLVLNNNKSATVRDVNGNRVGSWEIKD
jgi:hypothetical protein